jgi:hypothetical protein
MPARFQHAIDPEAAGTRLVHEYQRASRRLQLAHQPRQRVQICADPTVMTNLATFGGDGDVDRFFMHIHSDKQLARLATHGLSPLLG